MQLKFINNKTVLGYTTRQIIDCSFVPHRHVCGRTDGRMDGPIPLYLVLQTMGATVMVYENEIFSIVFLAERGKLPTAMESLISPATPRNHVKNDSSDVRM